MKLLRKAQDAFEARAPRSSSNGEVLRQSRLWIRATTWCLIGTAAFGLSWLALGKTEEIIVAPGKLEPLGGVRDIQIPVNGVIKTLHVKDGQKVKKGEVLLTLDPEANKQRGESADESLDFAEVELSHKQDELRQYLRLNNTEQSKLNSKLMLNEEILSRLTRLEAQGATSGLQLLQQKNQVEDIRGNLEQAKVDRLRVTAQLLQSIQELKSKISGLKSTVTEEKVTLRYQTIISPVNGVVFELKPKGPGFVSRDSLPIMKIVPDDKLEARVEIPSSDIGFVRTGQSVDISIDSYPASDFSVLTGKVRRIGSDALPPEPLKQQYRYPADISLSSQKLKLTNGKSLPLQVGMSLTANIKLRKVSYLQLLLGSFKDKADSLRRI